MCNIYVKCVNQMNRKITWTVTQYILYLLTEQCNYISLKTCEQFALEFTSLFLFFWRFVTRTVCKEAGVQNTFKILLKILPSKFSILFIHYYVVILCRIQSKYIITYLDIYRYVDDEFQVKYV